MSELVAMLRRMNGIGVVREAADRIEALELLCADKDASIAQLIEQLQKAEARVAQLEPYASLGAVHDPFFGIGTPNAQSVAQEVKEKTT